MFFGKAIAEKNIIINNTANWSLVSFLLVEVTQVREKYSQKIIKIYIFAKFNNLIPAKCRKASFAKISSREN